MKVPERPDAESIIAPLKPFQRRTVDHAFNRLYEAGDSSSRFLVADEVGLGKTLVARGVIARAIEHLWDTTERIDIIYICSNASIARSNLPKLQVGGSEGRALPATRLTMLATQLAESGTQLRDSKLNFVSFTPRTSFKLGHSTGQSRERLVLFHLLKDHIDRRRRTGLANLLQGTTRNKDRWRARIRDERVPLDQSIKEDFVERLGGTDLKHMVDEAIERWFLRYRATLPEEARAERNDVIGRLRQLLAECCLDALEPDLVIMDEFQRFKALLEPGREDPAADLAQALFEAVTPEGSPVRTLLLSATPYKLYTTDAEKGGEDDHYEDFVATTRFLLNDDGQLDGLREGLSGFRGALTRAARDAQHQRVVDAAKADVERVLCKVMARTERVVATDDRDAMVKEYSNALVPQPAEVQQYLAADDLFRVVGESEPIRYWRSAPYLAHFMRGYKFDRQALPERVEIGPQEVSEVIKRHAHAYLSSAELESWGAIDAGNAKLRDEMSRLLGSGLWRLLWVPPTRPYWPLEGPFAGQEGATKTLLFSAWNVVPDVVSAVLSYEAERRMVQGSRVRTYNNPTDQQGQRLTLDAKDGPAGRTRHRLLLLLMPCLSLADIHPLSAPTDANRRDWVRERVNDLLRHLPNPQSGPVDDRWEWVAPLLLDEGLRDFLEEWRDDLELPPLTVRGERPVHFNGYLDDLLDLDVSKLGRRPDSLPRLLADVALGSPAVLAVRMLGDRGAEHTRRRAAVRVADAFWHLFNRPAVIGLLDQFYGAMQERHQSEVETGYWRAVLRYSQDGNLQAVLDEEWHLQWEQSAWEERRVDDAIMECCGRMAGAILPTPSRVHMRRFDDFLEGLEEPELRPDLRVRTIFALRFGTDIEAEDGRPVSQDVVRGAFNSPFRPFVLASTSVGQEGLDFHPWCRRIVHWDLPGNPVDMEQREGRVHRYKCHAVRANVAAEWADQALERWQPDDDLWELIFRLANEAARNAGKHDLVPFWLAPGEHHVERHVPLLSYSREVEAFQRLKRQLAAYRVVFGQPRQEELVALLDRAAIDLARLRDWAIDLSPPSA